MRAAAWFSIFVGLYVFWATVLREAVLAIGGVL